MYLRFYCGGSIFRSYTFCSVFSQLPGSKNIPKVANMIKKQGWFQGRVTDTDLSFPTVKQANKKLHNKIRCFYFVTMVHTKLIDPKSSQTSPSKSNIRMCMCETVFRPCISTIWLYLIRFECRNSCKRLLKCYPNLNRKMWSARTCTLFGTKYWPLNIFLIS